MSLVTPAAWQRLLVELGAREFNGGLYNQLVASYSQPHRHYHTLQHLRECMAHFDAAGPLAQRPAEVEAALWFHDAVYDPIASDSEARSADWARRSLSAAGCASEVAERVAALVLTTQHQAVAEPLPPDAALLLDIDLAILGAAPARFDEYQRQIRAEYAHVPQPAFDARRADVLRGFLRRPSVYRTGVFHDALEATARGNLQRALG